MALTNYVIGTTAHPGNTSSIQDAMTQQGYRYLDLALLAEGATGGNQLTQARPGVLTAGSLDNTSQVPNAMAATAAGSGLNINIARGAAVVERDTKDGSYLVAVYSVGTVTLATADSTNQRRDRIDLQVLDSAEGDGSTQTAYVVTSGTGTPVGGIIPLAPAPPNSIPIAQVLLPANTSTVTNGMITKVRKSSALRGGIRVLLEGDSVDDPGYMVGEMRDTSAVQSPGTIDRWNTDTETWQLVSDFSGAAIHHTTLTTVITAVSGTSYVPLLDASSNSCGHTFVAPASGIVLLIWGGNFRSNASGNSVFVAVSVQDGGTIGAGTVVAAASDNEAIQCDKTGNAIGLSRAWPISGLTPGNTYNARLAWRMQNTGSSANADHPFLNSIPQRA